MPTKVYIRIRPLMSNEVTDSDTAVELKEDSSVFYFEQKSFTDNLTTYKSVLQPFIPKVITTCVFVMDIQALTKHTL
jgi:hypothetical protein